MDLYPLFENDLSEPGVIQAHMIHDLDPLFPKVAVLCFFNELLERMADEGRLRTIYTLKSEIGSNHVYEFATDKGKVAVVHPGVGAPLAAAFVEEMASLGVELEPSSMTSRLATSWWSRPRCAMKGPACITRLQAG